MKRARRHTPPPDRIGAEPKKDRGWVLRLYVAGMNRTSARAVERVHAICDEYLAGRYELEVIDIYQLPALARGHQIVATPTLIRLLPQPLRRYIGDLSDEHVVFGLDLKPREAKT
ncbi:MAG TPA: circadian clock KaiB family protein [Myxococcales bacterium]|nr:circadian clock KaiB family protein [Myxococcales bacterium]